MTMTLYGKTHQNVGSKGHFLIGESGPQGEEKDTSDILRILN
jgi:hypothetical protein